MTINKIPYHLIISLQSPNPLIRQTAIATLEQHHCNTLLARQKEDRVKFTVWSAEHNVAQYPSQPSSKVYHESPFHGITKESSAPWQNLQAGKLSNENTLLKERVNTAKPRINTGLNNTKPVQTEENTTPYFTITPLKLPTQNRVPNTQKKFNQKIGLPGLPPIKTQLYR
jgi:hypothetical protein